MWFKFSKAKANESPPDEVEDSESYDWDTEFSSMEDPELDEADGRNPIVAAVKGGKRSIQSSLKNPNFYKKNIEKVLPKDYGDVKTNIEPFTKGIKQLYNETTKEIKPELKEIASNVNRLIPAENKKIKDFYGKVVEKLGLNEETSSYSNYGQNNSREAEMTKFFEENFKKQQAINEAKEAKESSEENIEKAIDTKRFKSNMELLTKISDDISVGRQFNENLTFNYYKKSLELQYRHYFVMQDMLNESKKYYAESNRHQLAITKNTALPEIQKIRMDESLKEKARDSLLSKTIFGDQSYVQRGIENFKNRFSENINKANKTARELTQASGGILQGAEMGESMGQSKASMAGDFGASMLLDTVVGKFNKAISAKVFQNSDKGIYGKLIDANRLTSNLPGLMEKLSTSNKLENTYFDENGDYGEGITGVVNKYIRKAANKAANLGKTGARELIYSFNNSGIENELSAGKDADAFVVERGWDGRDKRTLNYVIPGYLARILQSTTMMATGQPTELITYDHSKATFSKQSDISKRIKGELLHNRNTNSYDSKLNSTVNIIDNEQRMSDKAKSQLREQLADIVKTKRNFDGAALINNEEFLSKFDNDIKEEINNALIDVFGEYAKNTKVNQYEFSKQMKETKESIANPNSILDLYAKSGQLDILEKMGIVTKDYFGKAKVKSENMLEVMTKGNLQDVDFSGETPLSNQYYLDMPKKTDRMIELLEMIEENTSGTVTSDINAKTSINEPKKKKDLLERFKKIKVFNWMYKKDIKDKTKHDGPMAQQLNSLFGDDVAPNGTSIDMASMNAINIEAIQELYDRQLSMEEQKELDGFDKSIDVLKSIKKDTAKISSTLQALTKLNIDLVKLTNQMANSGMFSGMFSFGGNGSYNKYTDDGLRDRINRAFSKEGSGKVFDYIKAGLGRGKKAIDEVSDVTKKYGTKAGKFTWDKTAGLRKYLFGLQNDKKVKEGETPLKDRSLVGDIKQYGPEIYTKLKDSFFDTTEWLGRKLSDTKDFIKPRAGNILSKSYNFLKDKALDLYNKPIDIYNKLDPTTPLLSARLMEMGAYFDKKTNQVIKNLSDIKGEVIDSEGRVVLTLEDIKIGLVDSEGIAVKLGVTKLPSLLKAGAVYVGSKLLNGFKALGDSASGFGDKVREWFSSSFGFSLGSTKSEEYLLQIRDMLNDRLPGERTEFITSKTDEEDTKTQKPSLKDKFRSMFDSSNSGVSIKDRLNNLKEKTKENIEKIKPDLTPKYKSGNVIDTMMGIGSNIKERLGTNKPNNDEFVGPQKPSLLQRGKTAIGKAGSMVGSFLPNSDKTNDEFIGPQKPSLLQRGKTAIGRVGTLLPSNNKTNDEFIGPQKPSLLQRGKAAIGNAGSMVGTLLSNSSKTNDESTKQNKETIENTDSDNSLMKKLLARLSPNKKGDKDGDGDVDGGFDDIEEQREKLKQERLKDRRIAEVDLAPKYKSNENIIDTMFKMISGAGGGLMGMLGGAADAAGTVGDLMPDGSRKQGPVSPTGKKPGLMSRAFQGTKNVLGKVGTPLANMAANSGMLGKLGALRAGLTGLGMALPGAAGAATSAAGLLTSGLASILASPVLIGGVAAGITAYGVYKGYQFLTRNSVEDIDLVRIRQYGLTDSDSSNYHLILELEQHLMETAVAYNNKQAFLNQDGIKVDEILDIFDIDKDDQERLTAFTKWFNGRFKPVFVTHLSALAKINPKYKLDELDSLSDKEKFSYLETIKMPAEIYTITDSPFEEGVLTATEKDVDDVIKTVKEDLDVPEEDKKKLSENIPSIKKDDPETAIAGVASKTEADEAADIAKEQSMLSKLATGLMRTTGIGAVYGAYKAIKGFFVDKESKPPIKLSKTLNEIQTVRFHTYGLKTLDIYKCSAIVELEAIIEKNGLTFKSDNSAVFNGDFNLVFDKIKTYFGVPKDNKEKYAMFFKWFNERFLPVYLAYVSFGKANTNKTSTSFIDTVLSPTQQAIVAKQISSLDVWSLDHNPFVDEIEIATDSSIVKPYIDTLDKKAKDEQIKKPTENETKDQTSLYKPTENETKDQTSLYKPTENKANEVLTNENKTDYSKYTPMQNNGAGEDGKPPAMVTSASAINTGISGAQAPSSIPMQGGDLLKGDGGWDAISSGANKLKGLHPDLLKQVLGAFEEYHKLTGKKIAVTDGFRSYQEQADLYKRMPNKAAKPGRSMHEFGLAFDADGKALNEMDKLGIMRKYGLTRPIGGENWHVEPAYVQTNLNLAKSDPNKASEMIKMSVGLGGGGIGTVPGSKLKSRDTAYALSLINNAKSANVNAKPTESSPVIGDPNLKSAGVNNTPVESKQDQTTATTNSSSMSSANPANNEQRYTPTSTGMTKASYSPSQQGSVTTASAGNYQQSGEDGKAPSPTSSSGKTGKVDNNVLSIIKEASSKSGISEDVMIAMAAIESSFNPNANMNSKAKAKGLYQFMPGTWKDMIRKYGHKYGIQQGTSVFDPKANSLMAAEYIKENFASIKKRLPQQSLGPVEAYIAHFLGGTGAAKFLSLPPSEIAAQHMPDAARSNANIFTEGGRPRTVAQIYKHLSDKMHNKAAKFGVPVNIAKANVMGGSTTSSANPLNTERVGVSAEQAASGNLGNSTPSIAGASSSAPTSSSIDTLTRRDNSYVAASNTTPSMLGNGDPTQVYAAASDSAGQATDANSVSSKVTDEVAKTLAKSLSVQERILKRLEDLGSIASKFNLDGLKEAIASKGTNILNTTNIQQGSKQKQQLDKPAVTFERTLI